MNVFDVDIRVITEYVPQSAYINIHVPRTEVVVFFPYNLQGDSPFHHMPFVFTEQMQKVQLLGCQLVLLFSFIPLILTQIINF